MNKDRIVLFANPAAAKLLNRTRDELIGVQFGFPSIGNEVVEINIPAKGRETGTAEMRQATIEWEGKEAYAISIHDISALKKTERVFVDVA